MIEQEFDLALDQVLISFGKTKVGADRTAFHIHEAPVGEGGGTAPSDGTGRRMK